MTLEERLLQAHARDDRAALVELYTEAANLREAEGDIDAACFFLTHAYIYALELAHSATAPLKRRLSEHGREK